LNDDLRHRQVSAMELMPSSLLAIAISFVERPGGFAWLNRRRRFTDYGIVRFARDVDGSQVGE
jgi:hypothetical protein